MGISVDYSGPQREVHCRRCGGNSCHRSAWQWQVCRSRCKLATLAIWGKWVVVLQRHLAPLVRNTRSPRCFFFDRPCMSDASCLLMSRIGPVLIQVFLNFSMCLVEQ